MPGAPVISQALGTRPERSARAARPKAASCPSKAWVSRGWANPSIRSLSLGSWERLAMPSYRMNRLQIETAADGAQNRFRHPILGSPRIDDPATIGMPPRHVQKSLAQPCMEIGAEFLKAIFRISARHCSSQGPLQTTFHIHIQDQGEIGRKIIQHGTVDPPDGFPVQPPARALIGKGGVAEAVANHPSPRHQRRPYGARHIDRKSVV